MKEAEMVSGTIIPLRRPGAALAARPPAAPFVALPPEEKAALLAACTRKRVAKGSTVFTQGTLHTTTFIVERGLVRTYYTSSTGKEVTMAYWSDGDLIGGPNVLTADTMHVWSARAVEDAEVWCIAAHDLELLVGTRPAIARFVIDSLTLKLFWLSALLQAFGTQSVFLRLAHLLLKLADLYGTPTRNGIAIRHYFTQEDLANMVGATRQWVSTTLRHFQNDGIVRCGKRQLEIVNVEVLRRIVGEAADVSRS
jgi:CRP/FNR family cyclic AMP-dependent transcriptional regulator